MAKKRVHSFAAAARRDLTAEEPFQQQHSDLAKQFNHLLEQQFQLLRILISSYYSESVTVGIVPSRVPRPQGVHACEVPFEVIREEYSACLRALTDVGQQIDSVITIAKETAPIIAASLASADAIAEPFRHKLGQYLSSYPSHVVSPMPTAPADAVVPAAVASAPMAPQPSVLSFPASNGTVYYSPSVAAAPPPLLYQAEAAAVPLLGLPLPPQHVTVLSHSDPAAFHAFRLACSTVANGKCNAFRASQLAFQGCPFDAYTGNHSERAFDVYLSGPYASYAYERSTGSFYGPFEFPDYYQRYYAEAMREQSQSVMNYRC